jgi:lipopolysaccharide export LptBFGC system permease protein LptF
MPTVTVSQPARVPVDEAAFARRSHHWRRVFLFDLAYAREMLLPMALGLIVLVLALAGNFVYWAINSVVNQGLSISPVVRLFILAAPGFAVLGITVGVILSVCHVLNRAVRDNEIVALRAGGASIPRIVAPFLVMSLFASFANWLMVEKVAPRTNDMANKTLASLMSRSIAPLIETDKYFRAGNYYFYVGSVQDNVLHNVMVYQREAGEFGAFAPTVFPIVRIAREAREDPKSPNQWILTGVVQHIYNADGSQLSEARLDSATINVGQQLSNYWQQQKEPFAMTGGELSQKIKDLQTSSFDQNKLREWTVDYYRRFSLPLGCFVMALLAAPLALRFARQGSFAGLVLAFGLGFFWQGFDGWFRALGLAGYIHPIVAAWSTDVLFALAGVALLRKVR